MTDVLKQARDFESQYSAFISPAERPAYHLSPMVGWMNDPNGFSLYKGQYHLFYQYHPYSTQWGPMHWGHAISHDMIRWEFLPCAIAPDTEADRNGCFSGSAIELEDGRQLLLYTGVQENRREDGTLGVTQTQCVAIGDGADYAKYEANPVLDSKDIPEGFSAVDFRDPKLYRETDGTLCCVAGNRTDDGSGSVLLYRSKDGLHWEFQTVLERSYNDYGKMWECPDFFPLGDRQIIMVSPQDMSPLGLEFHNGDGTLFIIGNYDKETDHFERDKVTAVDYGIDFYAPQTLLTSDGRRVMIAWMQNWDTTARQAPERKWFGQMTTPRELEYRDGRIIQNPIRELDAYRGRKVLYRDVHVQEEVTLRSVYGRIIDLTVTLRPGSSELYKMFRMRVARGSQHYTSISYCPQSSTLRVSRTHAGFNRDFVHERECLVRRQNGEIKLRILLDRFSVEVFVNDGEQAISTTIYTPLTADGISFEANGSVIMDVEKYDICL